MCIHYPEVSVPNVLILDYNKIPIDHNQPMHEIYASLPLTRKSINNLLGNLKAFQLRTPYAMMMRKKALKNKH